MGFSSVLAVAHTALRRTNTLIGCTIRVILRADFLAALICVTGDDLTNPGSNRSLARPMAIVTTAKRADTALVVEDSAGA